MPHRPATALHALALLSIAGLLGGCSGLVRSLVDTQPRVALDSAAVDHPEKIVAGQAVLFALAGDQDAAAGLDPDLIAHAPLIVQGFQPESARPAYAREDDAIGAPRVDAAGASVQIDTSSPCLFARVEHASVNGVLLKQLVYAFWYPRRPVGSIETGAVDGGVLRITLDAAGMPAVFEYTQPCGCFHGVFVSDALDADAAAQFGPPAGHRRYSTEPPLTGHDDWVVRDRVRITPGGRPALYISAGKHACQAILYRAEGQGALASCPVRRYALAPYSSLEHAPREGGGEASIFNDQGRVLGAQRSSEQFLMGDLDHAGWPRHLDAMLIHWDADRWTDPLLLASRLRLPDTITDPSAAHAEIPTDTAAEASTVSDGPRRLLLFTSARCAGCQLTKQAMSESPRLRRALRDWDYQLVDTTTEDGALLAAQYRVSVVPVLIGVVGSREVLRSEDLETEDKIAGAIAGAADDR